MSQVAIENPIINSPFDEPTRHFRFSDEGITDEEVIGRRVSSHFVPIARPRKKNGAAEQGIFETEWTQDRIEVNKLVNDIRRRVIIWRKGGFVGVTPTTSRLIAYWTDPAREKKLFFCQNEALQTAIYIVEVAKKNGDAWIENAIRAANDAHNPGLPRMAFKMATGAGKTVVMAMLIVWHTLNKHANPQDGRFSDTFLIVTPGITIRDRLRVLLPNDPENYYRQRDNRDNRSAGTGRVPTLIIFVLVTISPLIIVDESKWAETACLARPFSSIPKGNANPRRIVWENQIQWGYFLANENRIDRCGQTKFNENFWDPFNLCCLDSRSNNPFLLEVS